MMRRVGFLFKPDPSASLNYVIARRQRTGIWGGIFIPVPKKLKAICTKTVLQGVSLCFSFSVYNMGIKTVPTSQDSGEDSYM